MVLTKLRLATQRHLSLMLLAACMLLALMAYSHGAGDYFLFDDLANIVDDPHLRIQSLDFSTLRQAAFSGDAGMLGRPVSVLSFALDYYVNGLDPFHFRVTNIVIHLLNGLCIFMLTCLVLDTHRRRDMEKLDRNTVQWIGLAVAAAWVLHPLNLTSVLYIVQRMTSLAALFTLLGMIFYMHGRRHLIEGKGGWGWIAASVVICLPLAVFSKENGALLPIFLLLLEAVFFRFQAPSVIARRLLWGMFGATVLVPVVVVMAFLARNPGWITGGYIMRDFTLTERLLTEARVIWFYIRLTLVPDISLLGIYHDDIPVSRNFLEPVGTLFASAGLLLMAAWALLSIRRRPVAAFGIFFFLAGHSMESSVLALEITHEHRNYLPVFGLLLALFYYLLSPLRGIRNLVARRITAAIFILFFAGITFQRCTEWRNQLSMKQKEVEHHPDSVRANADIGALYTDLPAASQMQAQELYDRAYRHFAKASSLSSADVLGLFGLIRLNLKYAVSLEQSWIPTLVSRIERPPFAGGTANNIFNLQKCLIGGSCSPQPDDVEALLQAALRNPTLQGKARSQMLFARSDFLFRIRHQPEDAAAAAYQAVALNPATLDSHVMLIQLLVNMGKLDEARTYMHKVAQLDPVWSNMPVLVELERAIETARR